MGEVLGQMVMTSISVVLPGLYFLLMVERADGDKAFRYKFFPENDAFEELNNSISVGLVSYTLFVAVIPFLDWLFALMFGTGLRQAVLNMAVFIQIALLVMLTLLNMTMAYLGLQK